MESAAQAPTGLHCFVVGIKMHSFRSHFHPDARKRGSARALRIESLYAQSA